MFVIENRIYVISDTNEHRNKVFSAFLKSKKYNIVQDKNSLMATLRDYIGKTVQVILHSDSSWKVFQDAYASLDIAPLVILINKGSRSNDGVFISYDSKPFVLQNKIAAVNSAIKNNILSYVFMTKLPIILPTLFYICIFSSKANQTQKNYAIRNISTYDFQKYFFSAENQEIIKNNFPIQAWKLILTSKLPTVKFIGDECNIIPLRLNTKKTAKTLFVFPERMLPLSRAYYVRAFDILSGLFERGIGLSALIFGPKNSDLEKIRELLCIFTVDCHAYPLIRGNFTVTHRAIRKTELLGRKTLGIMTPPPMRFNERNMVFATEINSNRLHDVISSKNSIKNVIYTGAWFYPAIKNTQNQFPDIKWYCDTHDVFFVMDGHSNQDERRFLYKPALQKKRELDALNNSDGVIAISPSDANSFQKADINIQIFKESGSFEQASFGVDITNIPNELKFGFIGTSNNNNRSCLKLILDKWWPSILDKMPTATLVVAGSACNTMESQLLLEHYKDSVTLLGFVDDLSGFYNSVLVMISPIIVRGGLNFKSAEALISGRVLLTTPLGAECLEGVDAGVVVLNNDLANIDNVVEDILKYKVQTDLSFISKSAEKVFGQKTAYCEIAEVLR
jgi:hypothetical protein